MKVGEELRERKSISYAAFREFGVPADVLKRAGVTRGTRSPQAISLALRPFHIGGSTWSLHHFA